MSQPPVKEKDLTLHWLPLSLTVQWTRSEWDGKMSESCVLLSPGRPTVVPEESGWAYFMC